jgi:hypothetical protein
VRTVDAAGRKESATALAGPVAWSVERSIGLVVRPETDSITDGTWHRAGQRLAWRVRYRGVPGAPDGIGYRACVG